MTDKEIQQHLLRQYRQSSQLFLVFFCLCAQQQVLCRVFIVGDATGCDLTCSLETSEFIFPTQQPNHTYTHACLHTQ